MNAFFFVCVRAFVQVASRHAAAHVVCVRVFNRHDVADEDEDLKKVRKFYKSAYITSMKGYILPCTLQETSL